MSVVTDYSNCSCLRDILLLNKKEDLVANANVLGITVPPRASMSFVVNKLEDFILNCSESWLNYLPSADLNLIRLLINKQCLSHDLSLEMNTPQILPLSLTLHLIPFQLDEKRSVVKIWLTQDLYQSYSLIIDEIFVARENTPYPIVDYLFWGTLANAAVIEKDAFLEDLETVITPSDQTEIALDYFEHYIPQKLFYSDGDFFYNPMLSEDDLMYSLSIENDEILECPDFTFLKLINDGLSYPNLFANPVYFEPKDYDDILDTKYLSLFKDRASLFEFMNDCYLCVQRLVEYKIEELDVLSINIDYELYGDLLNPDVTVEQFEEAKNDVLLHMPIVMLNGHCLDEVKDLTIKLDNSEGEFDFVEEDATPIQVPSQSLSLNKVGRNDPCPCGSGKKFKNCHGRIAGEE